MSTQNMVAVTGVGMISSLGPDAATACAAARAGIQRREELEYPLRSPVDGSTKPAFGHRAPFVTEGFEGSIRLRQLLEAALRDLKTCMPDDGWPAATPVYIALPDPARVRTGINLIADEEERELDELGAEYPLSSPPDWRAMVEQAVRATSWPVAAPVSHVFTSGHTGFCEALQQALADIAAGRSQAALVGGVDSLIGELTLGWLERTRRLHTPANPVGLFPGEAAAVFVIEQLSERAPKRAPSTIIRTVATADDSRPLLSGEQSVGAALYDVIHRLISDFPAPAHGSTWFITDLNGEAYPAVEWGNVLVRMARRSSAYPNPIQWYPAASFGDVGAAMGAVSVCMAVNAWDRGYAPAARAILTASSEGPRRAAVLLEGAVATSV